MITSILYACVLVVALFFSLVRGTSNERMLGAIILAGNLATILTLVAGSSAGFSHVSVAYLLVDVAASFGLCFAAVRKPTWMAILVAAFQICGTLGHAVKLVAPETINLSYAILLRLWGWPMVLTLLLSHWDAQLRRILKQSDLSSIPRPLRPAPLNKNVPTIAVTTFNDDVRSEKAA